MKKRRMRLDGNKQSTNALLIGVGTIFTAMFAYLSTSSKETD
ncbi:MAG: hypothetical protein QM632_05550 [Micrococcaceae bacterium]